MHGSRKGDFPLWASDVDDYRGSVESVRADLDAGHIAKHRVTSRKISE